MTSKLLNNMTFKASDRRVTATSPVIIKLWEESIRGQLLVQLNMILQSKTILNNGFVVIHNGRTNVLSVKKEIRLNSVRKINYIYTKYVSHADIFTINHEINQEYYEILVKLMLNNITKIS